MKKKNYALVASFLMMLVATLTSCEKFALDETSTDPHDANANVTFHVSMGKNQSTEFNTKAAGFNTQLSGFNTKATDSNAIPLEKVCSRLSLGIFDEIGKVKTLNTLSTDKGYGNLSVSLDEGEYRVVIIGHNGAGNCTISSPEKIKFSNNKLTDTFYYYGRPETSRGTIQGPHHRLRHPSQCPKHQVLLHGRKQHPRRHQRLWMRKQPPDRNLQTG